VITKKETYNIGLDALTAIKQILDILHAGQDCGYAVLNEVFAPGMTAMAAPVQKRGYSAIGVISIAGPVVRLDEKRMHALRPALLTAASELAAAKRSGTVGAATIVVGFRCAESG
jgi:IclR family acetate operon transcriptional repressor